MVDPGGKTSITADVDSWSNFTELMKEHSDGTWIFRGATNVEYELIPKIGRPEWRHEGFTGGVRAFRPEQEAELLRTFKKQARPYIAYPPDKDIEWLAIAQHHGLPTRLLDWTESILVAAYFAVENGGVGGPAAIYANQPARLIDENESPFKIRSPSLYRPPHISPRIPAQRAVFSVSVDPTKRLTGSKIKKWRVPKRACFEIKRILDGNGISRASLFPDLDGLCGGLAWRYKWGIPLSAPTRHK
jgi:hypothetical protein